MTTAVPLIVTAAQYVVKTIIYAAASYAIGALAQSLLARPVKRDGFADTLLGLPVGNTDTGAPRVWAIGSRVRVPAQVMWQSRKVRTVSTSIKGKSGPSSRHVSFDCAFLLNDRYTAKMVQFIVNDNLLVWDSLNLVDIASDQMLVSASATQLTLTMVSTDDPDFDLVFEVGDMVELRSFVRLSGPDPNGRYWEVVAVTGHTGTPGNMVLEPRKGQTTTGVNVTAGNAYAPARVIRIDDAVLSESFVITFPPVLLIRITRDPLDPANHPFNRVFRSGDWVKISRDGVNLGNWEVRNADATEMYLYAATGSFGTGSGSTTLPLTFEFRDTPTFAENYLPSGFIARDYYHYGDDTQTEDVTMQGHEGAGEVGGFRGQAYQVLNDFDTTNFGGIIPMLTEALIEPDSSFTWAQAFLHVAARGGMAAEHIDTAGIDAEPFLGFYLRGPVTGVQALQQLLLAKQVATQDRGGVLSFFAIDNADQVAVNNGAIFTDFGAVVGEQPSAEKVSFAMVDEAELPTSVGIRFQDPSSGYGDNYEHFGLRHPSSSSAENRQELDLRNLVLTRKDARNLAATIARRARINSRTVAFTLPANYLHVLENDLLSFTDDQGETHLVRVVKREQGNNFLVRIQAVVERANIAVAGSPVQSAAGNAPPNLNVAANLSGIVFESPPVLDDYGMTPGFHAVCCARPGSSWAGATLYMSQDAGANWTAVKTFTVEHAIGVSTTLLAAATPSEAHGSPTLTWDDSGSITIVFDAIGPVPFVTVLEKDVIQGGNWFAILDSNSQVVEVFGARDVAMVTPLEYTFTYLLRGIRGTFKGCEADHASGVRIVHVPYFYPLSGVFVDTPGLSMGAAVDWKFVPPGRDVSTTPTIGITTRRRNVEPFPIRDITRTTDGVTHAATVEVSHWTRTNLPPGSVGPYPLDDPYEEYVFTLYDPTGTSSRRVRTKSARGTGSATLRDASVVFTAAEINAAGYTAASDPPLWIDVQQVGEYATGPSVLQLL